MLAPLEISLQRRLPRKKRGFLTGLSARGTLHSWTAGFAVGFICLLSFVLMLSASLGDSATMDELAHIPAGYSYVRYLDYRLNPEHPPLLKAVAALPLLFLNQFGKLAAPSSEGGLGFPTWSSSWTTDINGQWLAGAQFLYESGNDADAIVRSSRIGPILLTLLVTILIYLWARELMGRLWAILSAFLFALSPNILSHGHYVTTDIAAAFGVLLGTYAFLKFFSGRSRRRLVLAGIAFGIAQLTKFSVILLVPYFVFLAAVLYAAGIVRDWRETDVGTRLRRFGGRAVRYLGALAAVFAIGYLLIVYPVYALFTLHYPAERQAADTEFILASFAGGPTPTGELCKMSRCPADLNVWMVKHAFTRPLAHYLLGVLMATQRSTGGNTGYFLGEVSAAGWHSYFPIVYLLKEPLPVLIMVFLALILGVKGIIKKVPSFKFSARGGPASGGHVSRHFLDYLGANFAEFSMIVFIIFYWAYSVLSPLNIGFRHLIPTLPFIYVLTAGAMKRWVMKCELPDTVSLFRRAWGGIKIIFTSSLKYLVVFVLLLWFFLETVSAAPYFLSYFNELGGGPSRGYRYVTDSNYDWGQDLLRLKKFVDAHPEIDRIGVDYFGGGNPKYYLGAKEENWWSSRGNPADQNIHWLAISVNSLQGAIGKLVPGQKRNPDDEYRWLQELRPPRPGIGNVPEPDYKAGTSIFIYKL